MDLTKSYEFFKPDNTIPINIIGCGSVGSTVAENLARFGFENLILWDFDIVERHNIANQMFRERDIGKKKTEAVKEYLSEINPTLSTTIRTKDNGWRGETLAGYIFLCVDTIELRREIAQKSMYNINIKALFDFRTRLLDAQHYAVKWTDLKAKKDYIETTNFTHDEAKEATPVSACNIALSVCPTIRIICAYGVANFINFVKDGNLKKIIIADAFSFETIAI